MVNGGLRGAFYVSVFICNFTMSPGCSSKPDVGLLVIFLLAVCFVVLK